MRPPEIDYEQYEDGLDNILEDVCIHPLCARGDVHQLEFRLVTIRQRQFLDRIVYRPVEHTTIILACEDHCEETIEDVRKTDGDNMRFLGCAVVRYGTKPIPPRGQRMTITHEGEWYTRVEAALAESKVEA